MLTLEGVTIQTALGPVSLLEKETIIPTPVGPVTIQKTKTAEEEKKAIITAATITEPTNIMLPIILTGLVIGGIVLYIRTEKKGK